MKKQQISFQAEKPTLMMHMLFSFLLLQGCALVGLGIGSASKRTVSAVPTDRNFTTPQSNAFIEIIFKDSTTIKGKCSGLPERELQNFVAQLPDTLHALLNTQNLPAIGEKVTVRYSNGGIRRGKFSGFVFGGIIMKKDDGDFIHEDFKKLNTVEKADGHLINRKRWQNFVRTQNAPIFSKILVSKESTEQIVDLKEIQSLTITKNYKQAGLVIGFLADATILVYILIRINSIEIFPGAPRS